MEIGNWKLEIEIRMEMSMQREANETEHYNPLCLIVLTTTNGAIEKLSR